MPFIEPDSVCFIGGISVFKVSPTSNSPLLTTEPAV